MQVIRLLDLPSAWTERSFILASKKQAYCWKLHVTMVECLIELLQVGGAHDI